MQLILEVRGYNGPGDLGFELSSEASSFLDRRCRYPGKSLASFIPQASPEALQLLEKLMDLNPKNRPSASGALEFDYISDAQLLHEYTDDVMPRRVDEKFFDFEREEYSLEALQKMVLEEVARPCDDSIFFVAPPVKSTLNRQTSREAAHTSSASSLSNASSAGSFGTAYESSQGHLQGHKRGGSDAHPSEGDDSGRVEYSNRREVHSLMRSDSIASADAPEPRSLTRSKSAPPSPSPQKMEMIAKQEKKHKRRFFLQGLQRLKQDQQDVASSDLGSSRSDRDVASKSERYGSGPEDLTSRRDRVQPAGVLRGNGSKYLQSSSASGVTMEARDVHRGSASADPTTSSSSSHLFSQFTNMGFSRGSEDRKLASAPPPSDSRSTTRLPALQNRGNRQQAGYR